MGKGITFDTGGISIKPAAGMENMTSDMGGAAAVISTVVLAAKLGLPVNVVAYVPMAENMPSATAQRPGDVLTQYGGITIEVVNTDAEGRLILADAMVRAGEDNPDYMIDTATLTGAQMVALGNRTPPESWAPTSSVTASPPSRRASARTAGPCRCRRNCAEISTPRSPTWPMSPPTPLGAACWSQLTTSRNSFPRVSSGRTSTSRAGLQHLRAVGGLHRQGRYRRSRSHDDLGPGGHRGQRLTPCCALY